MDKATAYRIGEEYIAFLINEKKYDIKKAVYLFWVVRKRNACITESRY
jgi:hypothetical protein